MILIDALDSIANEKRGIYLHADGSSEDFISYSELKQQSLRILTALQVSGVKEDDEVVLQFASMKNFIINYWACLHGRFIPVPLEYGNHKNAIDKVFSVCSSLKKPWIATDSDSLHNKYLEFSQERNIETEWSNIERRVVFPFQVEIATDKKPDLPRVNAHDIAFVQFSSGSTGEPKGVSLTHKNLLTNIGDILQSINHSAEDKFISWKPITHDFGMIAFHLAPIVGGNDQIRIATSSFVWKPKLWMDLTHKYRATVLGSPNFGYRHFLKKLSKSKGQVEEWDLSSVKVILNGAEPISQSLCKEFVETLAPYKLSDAAMTPGYGLAEGSLISSLCPVGEVGIRSIDVDRFSLNIGDKLSPVSADNNNAVNFVDCGVPYLNTSIRITDNMRVALPLGHVGRIEIKGGSVTSGYYLNSEATSSLLSEENWLDTRDLGALVDGRLYVVGRMAEMIIIGGVNYFPNDIEKSLLREFGESELSKYIVSSIKSDDEASEKLVVFVYYKKSDGDFKTIARRARQCISENFALNVSYVVPVAKIPKTTSGKVQRFKLVNQLNNGEFDKAIEGLNDKARFVKKEAAVSVNTANLTKKHNSELLKVKSRLTLIAEKLLARKNLDEDLGFLESGFSSLMLADFASHIEAEFGITLDSTELLDFPTLNTLAGYIISKLDTKCSVTAQEDIPTAHSSIDNANSLENNGDVAIIAVACRFPGGCDTPVKYWQLLDEGIDPIVDIPDARWKNDAQSHIPVATRQGGFLDNIEEFDPLFFSISPNEATAIDPQHRLLLEVCHEAIENAGYTPEQLKGSQTGIFVGISASDYVGVAKELGHETGPYTFTGSMFNAAAGRLSYTFGFEGPSVAIDTACSSSLVAVLNASTQLRQGECDLAFAGGVNLILKPDGHISFSKLNALSESGRCRSFDQKADGYIRSEGCGFVVLKRLSDAERDGDKIMSIIKGGAINHNGRSGGLTVPSGVAQQKLIERAHKNAKVSANEISYVECHGPGTKLGDPQELNALTRVFDGVSEKVKVGSVKSNIGHLESAAGIAGLIKTVLMLKNNRLVANLHFDKGNELIDWQNSPVTVVSKAQAWDAEKFNKRVAGISSFGISGTNAHIVLESYNLDDTDEAATTVDSGNTISRFCPFTLSAPSPEALQNTAQRFLNSNLDRADIERLCFNVNIGRSESKYRFAASVDNFDTLQRALVSLVGGTSTNVINSKATNLGKTVFIYSGQGSIYPRVGEQLFIGSSIFRSAFEACSIAFEPAIGSSLVDLLTSGTKDINIASDFDAPLISQPLIFSLSYALTRFWNSLGIQAGMVLGHSIGEYAAALEAGVISFDDAVSMVAMRATLMDGVMSSQDEQQGCTMASILASEEQVAELIKPYSGVYIAAINTPENITVSGSSDELESALAAARKSRIFTQSLPMKQKFHTPHMAESAAKLKEKLDTIQFSAPSITFVSCQLGKSIDSAEEIGSEYWSNHLCEPVLFSRGVEACLQQGASEFLEMGGQAVLCGLAAQNTVSDDVGFFPSLREGKDSWLQISESLSEMYLRGHSLNWPSYYNDDVKVHLNLPNTAYNKQKYWYEKHDKAISISKSDATAPNSIVNDENISEDERLVASGDGYVDIAIRNIIAQVTGVGKTEIKNDIHIFELGVDSLMLTLIEKRIVKKFEVEIPISLFFSDINTPRKISAYVSDRVVLDNAEIEPNPPLRSTCSQIANLSMDVGSNKEALEAVDQNVLGDAVSNSAVHELVKDQIVLMREQLVLLRASNNTNTTNLTIDNGISPATKKKVVARSSHRVSSPSVSTENSVLSVTLREEDVTAEQAQCVKSIVNEFVRKTPLSKEHSQKHRRHLADWVTTLNFSLSIKEMAYPITSSKSQAGSFTDLDGNEYVDTAIGYGAAFFGHNPEFVVDAIKNQLTQGFEIGPQSYIAGEVAKLISEFTHLDRVAFCNSGTEAVMAALRLARCVTGRSKVVKFTNSYHGTFDGVLADAGDNSEALPSAPGIASSFILDTIVLAYNTDESLKIIREMGNDLAAVLVEPVQSRNPENYSQSFLQELREITGAQGIALIFDEIITGFRFHTGGAQAIFGVQPDIAAYGKVLGGGMPIGALAGSAYFLDAIDGGYWEFGDVSSSPTKETTIFAGTFCKHPLAMSAALAVLNKLKLDGPEAIERTNELSKYFVERVNKYFAQEEVPLLALRFGSMYRFESKASVSPASSSLEVNLLYKIMLIEGIYVWERRTSFFCTEHTRNDADKIFKAVVKAVKQLRNGGFEFRIENPKNAYVNRDVLNTHNVISHAHVQTKPKRFMLSSEERRMYVLSLMNGGESAYHVTGVLRLKGDWKENIIRNALEQLTKRHTLLRSSYSYDDGEFVRTIANEIDISFNTVVSTMVNGEVDDAVRAAVQPFDLSSAPLWRVTVISVSDGTQLLVLDFHHIIVDGISMSILIEELLKIYQGDALKPLECEYTEYVEWEKALLVSDEYEKQKLYWKERLAMLPKGSLPTDHARPAVNDFSGNSYQFTLNSAVHDSVKQLARQQCVTPFMVLLSIYFVFLIRLSRERDVVVGTPFDRRNCGELSSTVGMFAQTLLIRADIEHDADFISLIQNVSQRCIEAFGNSGVSLDVLVDELDVTRDQSRNPIFDTMFIYEKGDRRNFSINGNTIEAIHSGVKGSAFDITLEITEQKGVLDCIFVYATRLFEKSSIERWAESFQNIAGQLLSHPDRRVDQADLMTAHQKEQVLVDFNKTQLTYDAASLATLLSDSAEQNADNIAVKFGLNSISYGDLMQRSNLLAAEMKSLNLGKEPMIGIMLNRGIDMIVGMIACVRCGFPYVPIDSSYPHERVKYMVEQSCMKLMLCAETVPEEFQFRGSAINPADYTDASKVEKNTTDLSWPLTTSLAYVIFTSGSTGKPKGVMIEQASVVNFIHGMSNSVSLPDILVTLGLTSVSFDIFVLEIFLTLAKGGTLVLAPEETTRDPSALASLIVEENISLLQITPSRLQTLLIGRKASDVLAGVKTLLVGGEPFVNAILPELQALGSLDIYNMYGPTETTVWSTVKNLTHSETLNIGKPIANTHVYILDEKMQPVPVGCVGDLYIGGRGLARGYFNDEDKTNNVFLNDPLQLNSRMYLTGDKASWTNDGDICFQGRLDDQIKLRGYRIEIGEIESILDQIPGIERSAVAIRDPSGNNPLLVAYCVVAVEEFPEVASQAATTKICREVVGRFLPIYMQPSSYVIVEQLPYTPNGKLDRSRLPSTVFDISKNSCIDEPTALEIELLDVWRNILGKHDIQLTESFFDAGGTSFSLVAMHSEVSSIYPGAVDVADIFAEPTIAALSKYIEHHIDAQHQTADVHIWPEEIIFPSVMFNAQLAPKIDQFVSSTIASIDFDNVVCSANKMKSDPLELMLGLFIFYLGKVTNTDAIELGVVSTKPNEYEILQVDTSDCQNVDDLIGRVKTNRQIDDFLNVNHRLKDTYETVEYDNKYGARILFSLGNEIQQRSGFDCVVNTEIKNTCINISMIFDSTRLSQTSMQELLEKYIKTSKILLEKYQSLHHEKAL